MSNENSKLDAERAAFQAYLDDCREHDIEPSAASAFRFALQANSLPVGVPDGLAAALFNALGAYEATRDSFPALKDKAIHIEQCEMLRQHASQLLAAAPAAHMRAAGESNE